MFFKEHTAKDLTQTGFWATGHCNPPGQTVTGRISTAKITRFLCWFLSASVVSKQVYFEPCEAAVTNSVTQ